MSSFIQFISPLFQHTISHVLYKQSHNHTALTCQSSTFWHKIKCMPIKLEPLLVDVANKVGLFTLVKRAPPLEILDLPLIEPPVTWPEASHRVSFRKSVDQQNPEGIVCGIGIRHHSSITSDVLF